MEGVPGFAILGLLGEGGMGRVHRARREADGRVVALKVIRPRSGGAVPDPYRRRFLRETQVMRGLDHPGLPGFVDAGVTLDGLPWLAGELLEGTTLEGAPGYGAWTPALLVPRLRALLATLSYLHARGLIHRDIKPSNVFLVGERTVLLDLGLVFVEEGTRLTATGEVAGTLQTMAPEQLRGDPASPGTDLYQLAVTAWFALTGRPPRPDADLLALASGGSDLPAPVAATGDPGLDAFLSACLAADPGERPGDAASAARLLDGPPDEPCPTRTLGTRPVPPPDLPGSRRWRGPLAPILTLLVLSAILVPRLTAPSSSLPAPHARPRPERAAAPSALDGAHSAWQAFLDRHRDYDPLAELLIVAALSLPPTDADLDGALDLLEPLVDGARGAGDLDAVLLAMQVLLARRDRRAHEVLRRVLPRLIEELPMDDPRTPRALSLGLDAAMAAPREWRRPDPSNHRIRSDTLEVLAPPLTRLAAADPDPSRATLWRVHLAAFVTLLGRPEEFCREILQGCDLRSLAPNQRWRWHFALTRLVERSRRFDLLTGLYAEGAASAPTRSVRLYFETRERQVQLEFVFQ